MTISPSRAAYFFEDIGYLLERGFRQIAFAPASGVFWDDEATRLLDEQLALVADDFVSWIREGRPRPPYFTTVLRRLAYLWVEARHGAAPLRNATCGAGRSVLAVAPNGELYPCHRAAALVPLRDELKMGDIFRGVINADLALRLSLLGPDEAGLRCRDCARRRHCGRFCPVQNFCEAGDVAMVPDSACHANLRLQKVADRISTALADEPCYRSYIEPFQTSDPDERHLPLLAELERDPAAIADKAARLLEAMGKMEDE